MPPPIDLAGRVAVHQTMTIFSAARNPTVTLNTTARTGSAIAATDATGGSVDSVAPEVADFSPVAGTPINPYDPVALSVTDDVEIGSILIAVRYNFLNRVDLAYDGTDFCGGYSGTRTEISGGFRFEFLRVDGWLAPPTIQVFAIDAAGNEL
jgi:hypothetical protein